MKTYFVFILMLPFVTFLHPFIGGPKVLSLRIICSQSLLDLAFAWELLGNKRFANGVFFSTKKCAFYLKKMQYFVFFLKIFRPLKG